MCLGVAYLAVHPEMWVRGFFILVDLVPLYATFAGDQAVAELKDQLNARFR